VAVALLPPEVPSRAASARAAGAGRPPDTGDVQSVRRDSRSYAARVRPSRRRRQTRKVLVSASQSNSVARQLREERLPLSAIPTVWHLNRLLARVDCQRVGLRDIATVARYEPPRDRRTRFRASGLATESLGVPPQAAVWLRQTVEFGSPARGSARQAGAGESPPVALERRAGRPAPDSSALRAARRATLCRLSGATPGVAPSTFSS
jgi:hypothetical protein